MKTKETVSSKTITEKPTTAKAKTQSLRPMRSMVALRSFKPRTAAAAFAPKTEEVQVKN